MPEPDVVPVAPDMVVSETLGGYDLLRRLGSGGMAEVHLARANGIEGFQKLVVLKQILPHLSRDKHFVRMFLAEARVAALLDHPNVVQVFDLGKEEGEYFFTMEFVYGESLQGLLKGLRKVEQPLAIEHVVTLGLGIAAGLHCAHERVGFDGRPLGIVHRDVSPTNVMITYEGGVKVADFGIAKVITRTDVTRAGTRKGKVPYMSPEQCRAEKIDRRSDVFSLGIVLWECVTGKRLFEGDNEFGVMNLIVNGQIQLPSSVRPDTPPGLEAIIMKALTVDKEARYQTARELQLDLEHFAREAQLRATPSALAELMHYLFRPQPFPWGALRGNSGHGQMSPATIAEISQMVGSQVGIPGTGVSRSAGGSYASQILGGPLRTGSSIGSVGTFGSSASQSKVEDSPSKTLRNIAIGLGATAALALVLVLGLWIGGRGASDEAAQAKADEAAAQAAEAEAAEAETPPSEAETPPSEAETPPSEAETPPTDPEAVADGEAAGADAGEVADGGADDAAVAEAVEEPPAEPTEDEAEDELMVLEDDPSTPRKSTTRKKTSTKPTSTKKKKPGDKKKPDLDAFMPGMGG